MPSCKRTDQSHQRKIGEQKTFEDVMAKAEFYEKENPDSALILTNKALDLMQNLKFQSNDTLFSLLKMKAYLMWGVDKSDSALLMLSDAHRAAKNTTDTLYHANIALLAGSIALKSEKYDVAEEYLLESIALFEKVDQGKSLAKAYNRYGNLLITKSDNNKALEYLLKAYKILEKQKNLHELSSVCLSIGNTFMAIGSPEEKLRFFRLALEAGTLAKDTLSQVNALVNLGVHYRKILPDSSLFYYHRVIELSTPGKNNQDVVARYNIANIYFDQKKYNLALEFYNQILKYCLDEKIYQGAASAYSGIAAVYSKMGNQQKAIDFIKIGMTYADSTGDKAILYKLKDGLHTYYEESGNFREAYLVSEDIKAFNDSTQALDMKIALHEMEIRYETEKKEAENERLNLEVISQKQISKSRAYIILLLIFIALLSIFFSWKGYSLYRERSIAYNVLMKKYEEEKAQRDLAESLQKDASKDVKPDILISADELLIENLIQYYHDEKPYLNPKLRVDDVAAKLNTTQKIIAAALKQFNNSNFNTFTNQYRIEEAKRIMENLSDDFYKVEAVAYDSGFGSKSSFYVAFEQFTGVKPSYYRSFMYSRKAEAS